VISISEAGRSKRRRRGWVANFVVYLGAKDRGKGEGKNMEGGEYV
jgi:hypothetical protein